MINIKFLRGTKAQNDAYVGKVGTVTVDLTDKSLRVHDGVTVGGKKIPNTAAVEQLIENYLFLHSNSGDHDSRYYTQTQVDNKIADIPTYDDSGIRTLIDDKVDKVAGKGLSTNDFTNVLSDKLNTIESGAEKNVGTNLGLSGTGNTKTLTSSTGNNISLPVSTTTNAGLMSTGDKTKLNSVETGAEVNVGTSLGSSRNATSYTVTSSTGNNTSLASASTTAAGVMSASDKTKLDGVATGAEVNSVTSVAGKDGDVNLSKSDVGLGSVDNTSDADKPVSTAQQSALNSKVNVSAIVNGLASTAITQPLSANQGRVLKGYVDAINDVLQSNDGTLDELQEIVDYIKANRDTLETLGISNIAGLQSALNAKVDAVAGKGLSSNDYTDGEKSKLSGIASGAEVNVGTNLGLSGTGNARTLTSSTGNNTSLPIVSTTNAGLMSTGDKSKLNGIEAGAEVNTVTSVADKTGDVTLSASDVGGLSDAATTSVSAIRSGTTKANVGLSAVRNVSSYSQSESDGRYVSLSSNQIIAGVKEFTDGLKIGTSSASGDSLTFDGETSSGLRLHNDNGYISLTPLNSGWAHIYTDRSDFIFNKPVSTTVNRFRSYNNDLRLDRIGATKLTLGNQQATFVDKVVAPTFEGEGTGLTGTAPLRATGTTKADVGLSAVRNVASYSQNEANARYVRRDAETLFDVGRGAVYLENNTSDNQDGAGITLRAANNPGDGSEGVVGSIFAVRSSGQATRLWVGQSITSTGSNDFKTVNADVSGDLDVLGVLSGDGSGLTNVDADTLDGKHAGAFYEKTAFSSTGGQNTPVTRDGAGDIRARLFRSEYTTTNSDIGVVYTARNASNDFMRPSTPNQVKAALSIDVGDVSGLSDAATTTVSTIRSGTTKADVGLSNVRNVDPVSRTGDTMSGELVLGGGGYQEHIRIDRGEYSWRITPTTTDGGILRFINFSGNGFQFMQGMIRGDGLRLGGAVDDGINPLQVNGGVRADSFSAGGAQNAQESIDTGGNIQIRNQGQLKLGNFSLQYNADTESLDFSWIGG